MLRLFTAVLFTLVGLNSYAQPLGRIVPLNVVWRVQQSSTDLMSTADATERSGFQSQGAFAYLSRYASSETAPLYRLLKPTPLDHMDSTLAGEGGYQTEGTLGYGWLTATLPGLAVLRRRVNFVNNDHSTHRPGEGVAAYFRDDGVISVYGLPRFGLQKEVLKSVYASGVTIESNLAAGGAIWTYSANGVQYINDFDLGRQMQAAMFPYDSNGTLTSHNPNEAGDRHGVQSANADDIHGSPLIAYTTSQNFSEVIQSTRALPLEWTPAQFVGGGAQNPVIWADVTIGKDVRLNWLPADGIDRNWQVVAYDTVITAPATQRCVIEAPTAYLVTSFNSYFQYNFQNNTSNSLLIPNGTSIGISPVPLDPRLAIIVSQGTSPAAISMGVFASDPNAGITLYNQTGSSNGQYGSSFTKWGVRFDSATTQTWRFRTWIVTGTRTEVEQHLATLGNMGLHSR